MSRDTDKPKKGFWKTLFRPKHGVAVKKRLGTETVNRP